MTMASRVFSSAMIEQLHCSGPRENFVNHASIVANEFWYPAADSESICHSEWAQAREEPASAFCQRLTLGTLEALLARQYANALGRHSVAAKYRQHGYQDRDRKDNDRVEAAPRIREKNLEKNPAPKPLQRTTTVSDQDPCTCPERARFLAARSAERFCRRSRRRALPKCGFELHSCKQCMYFDPGSRFECMQPVKDRVAKKDARNDCTFYEIRVTREKETSTPASLRPNDARQAFENLFKK